MKGTQQRQQTCDRCGMEQGQWSANAGKGVKQQNRNYCCEGCADDTGCICE